MDPLGLAARVDDDAVSARDARATARRLAAKLRARALQLARRAAVRAFSAALLHSWCKDPSPHVRRLVSEGTRPRLPLAGRIRRFQQDPRPVLALLEKLKADPELYVRRSAANNLNDIAKDNPELVVQTLRQWSSSKDSGTHWVVKHAARSLVKAGHPEVLALLGFDTKPAISVSRLSLAQDRVRIGEDLSFTFTLQSKSDEQQQLVVDYVVHFRKANGKTSPKVFKLRKFKLAGREKRVIEGRRQFRVTSIRALYPGVHQLQLQINGVLHQKVQFELEPALKKARKNRG